MVMKLSSTNEGCLQVNGLITVVLVGRVRSTKLSPSMMIVARQLEGLLGCLWMLQDHPEQQISPIVEPLRIKS